jgi:hypothetical protein
MLFNTPQFVLASCRSRWPDSSWPDASEDTLGIVLAGGPPFTRLVGRNSSAAGRIDLVNYWFGQRILGLTRSGRRRAAADRRRRSKRRCWAGSNTPTPYRRRAPATRPNRHLPPLAISFFTFQQIEKPGV